MMCRFVEWRLANQGCAGLRVLRHLERCESCQHFHASLVELECTLRGGAALASDPAARESRNRVRYVLPALVLSSVAVAISLLWLQIGSGTKLPSQQSYRVTTDSSRSSDDLALAAAVTEHKVPRQAQQREDNAAAAIWQHVVAVDMVAPLETELLAWQSDGQRGLDAILGLGLRQPEP